MQKECTRLLSFKSFESLPQDSGMYTKMVFHIYQNDPSCGTLLLNKLIMMSNVAVWLNLSRWFVYCHCLIDDSQLELQSISCKYCHTGLSHKSHCFWQNHTVTIYWYIMMQVGGSFGATCGLLLMKVLPSWNIQPGVYAMCAATAMLGGVFRASISLTVLLVEGTQVSFLSSSNMHTCRRLLWSLGFEIVQQWLQWHRKLKNCTAALSHVDY